MKIHIESYREGMVDAVREFNRRLDLARTSHSIRLPEHPIATLLPKTYDDDFGQECFVALEGGCVRGGYILYHQLWSVRGEIIRVGNCMRPISEGVIDPGYGMVGLQLIHDSLRRQPLQFGLGLGVDGLQTRILRALRWDIWVVPFYFKVLNGARFLRNFQPLRRNRASAVSMNLIAASGLAGLGAGIVRAVTTAKPKRPLTVEVVNRFSSWADELFEGCQALYSVLEVRDSAVLNNLFCNRPEFTCLKVLEEGRPVGWAVLEITNNQARFGEMKVRSILDCLARPEDAPAVILAASAAIEERGADLIISNQSHPQWQQALRRAGFFSGPSTFLFASVPALTKLLRRADPERTGMHFTRGGGDVPLDWDTDVRRTIFARHA